MRSQRETLVSRKFCTVPSRRLGLVGLASILIALGCGGNGMTSPPPPPPPDFRLTVTAVFSQTSVSVQPGTTSVPVTVSVSGMNGFTGSAVVSIAGLPVGATTNPALPLSLGANSSQQFTVTTIAGTPTGDSSLALQAISGSITHTANFTLSSDPAPQTSQSGNILYLESYSSSHTARIGLDLSLGGSIVELSLDGTNFVNMHDAGREVQSSVFDGAGTYDTCSGCSGNFGWNPSLAGDAYGNGSPVLGQQVTTDSLYVKTQPLQWYPDNKGGNASDPIVSDTYIEQTVSVVPGAPLAFQLHLKLTHFGTDLHYNVIQEFPSSHLNGTNGTLYYYSGTAPWTRDTVNSEKVPANPGPIDLYVPELWAAMVDSNGMGMTLFLPAQAPWDFAQSFSGGDGNGPTSYATNYLRPRLAFTLGPNAVIQDDAYLLAGDYSTSRDAIYGLHQVLPPTVDVFPPFGNLDLISPTISGNSVTISGWAIDDTAVSGVQVFVDGQLNGNATYGINNAGIQQYLPNAPVNCGWTYTLDSTRLANGTHVITVQARDPSNNLAIFPPVAVTVSN
jgi:hypothetical protein